MSKCRCASPDYLVMTRQLLADFENLAAERELEQVRHYINKLAIEYEKPDAFNPRKFMWELSEALKQGAHNV